LTQLFWCGTKKRYVTLREWRIMFVSLTQKIAVGDGPEEFGMMAEGGERHDPTLIRADSIVQITPLKNCTKVIYAAGNLSVYVIEAANEIVSRIEEASRPSADPATGAVRAPRAAPVDLV
jgi:hypothetical protein